MARTTGEILDDIRAFEPVESWLPLDGLLAELWNTGEAGSHVSELLAVLERFPEEADGCGVLWSVVHGVESLPGFELDLVESVRRQPTGLGVTMIGRLLNSGVSQVGDVSLIGLLREIATSTT